MTGYEVKPRGVVSKFKHGGFVVSEEGGHGLVLSINTFLGQENWQGANTACDELILNGYSDWHLPSLEEFKVIDNFQRNWSVEIISECYWSNYIVTNDFNKGTMICYCYDQMPREHNFYPDRNYKYYIAVRVF